MVSLSCLCAATPVLALYQAAKALEDLSVAAFYRYRFESITEFTVGAAGESINFVDWARSYGHASGYWDHCNSRLLSRQSEGRICDVCIQMVHSGSVVILVELVPRMSSPSGCAMLSQPVQ